MSELIREANSEDYADVIRGVGSFGMGYPSPGILKI